MLSPEEARHAVLRDWTRVLDTLSGADVACWTLPTRCQGWTVTDLVRHVVWGTSMEADALARARTGVTGSGEGCRTDDDDPAALLSLLRSSVAALDDELARAASRPADGVITIPFGPIPLGFGLDVFTMEAGVHADDLVDALGRDEPLAPDVVAATSTVLAAVLPALAGASDTTERPGEGTVVAVRGPTVGLAFAFDGGGWRPLDDPSGVASAATVVALDDTAALRFALGRAGSDAARVTVGPGAARFERWFPGL